MSTSKELVAYQPRPCAVHVTPLRREDPSTKFRLAKALAAYAELDGSKDPQQLSGYPKIL